jgi:hypothetical protein
MLAIKFQYLRRIGSCFAFWTPEIARTGEARQAEDVNIEKLRITEERITAETPGLRENFSQKETKRTKRDPSAECEMGKPEIPQSAVPRPPPPPPATEVDILDIHDKSIKTGLPWGSGSLTKTRQKADKRDNWGQESGVS